MSTKKQTAKASTRKTASKPQAKATAHKPMFGSKTHKPVTAAISYARRAIHERIQKGPVTVEQLATELAAKYGISRGTIDQQLTFEFKTRKTPVLKLNAKKQLVMTDAYPENGLGFRRVHSVE